MKRTIASSFLFLYPLGLAYERRDKHILYACTLGLAASLLNHSHTFHPDTGRRLLFGTLDSVYMTGFPFYLLRRCFTRSPRLSCYLYGYLYLSVLILWYGIALGGRRYHVRAIEEYTPLQRWGHVGFHLFGILGGTAMYDYYG